MLFSKTKISDHLVVGGGVSFARPRKQFGLWGDRDFVIPPSTYQPLPEKSFHPTAWNNDVDAWTNEFINDVAAALPSLRGSALAITRTRIGLAIVGAYNRGTRITDSIDPGKLTAADDRTLLGNASPVDYSVPEVAGEDAQLAWLPMNGPANSWMENTSGKKQYRYFDGAGNAAVDIDFGHDHGFGSPHSHNFDGIDRDHGNLVSRLW